MNGCFIVKENVSLKECLSFRPFLDILMDFLSVHPNVKPTKNEAHFFNKKAYAKGINYYRRKMPVSSPEQITLEKTPNYFEVKVVPPRVKKMNSTIKLILIARY